jgi:hypothetical protein
MRPLDTLDALVLTATFVALALLVLSAWSAAFN